MSDQNKTKEQLLLELEQARLRIGELEHSLAECVGQKEAGQRVTASRLLQALELGNLAYWEFDIPRQIFHLNDQYLALLGTSVAQEGGYEISASNFIHRFVHPEDVSIVAEEIRKGIETTDPNYRNMAEFRLKRVDGKIIHVLVSFGIDKDENGRTVLGYGTNQDITERKHTEQALEIERSRLKAVLDNMPLGVFMIEAPLGIPILANQKAIEILGKGIAPDAKSEDLSEVYAAYLAGTDELYPTERLPIVNGLQGRSIKIDDMEVRRPDGQNILLEVAGAPVYDSNGNIIASVIAFQDITERKQTQNSLQRERGLLRSLIDSVPDLIFYKDDERIYLGCNKAFEQFAGIKEADMVGKSDTDLFPREVAEFFREQDRQMLAERNSRRNEEWVTYPDGRRALLDTLKTPFYTENGDILGLIGISRDITDTRQAEQMIAERARQLGTVAKVSSAVSTILEPQAMLQAVVDLTKESFNLYHAHIYLLDEEEQKLVLTSGAGQVGVQMVAEKRSISYEAEQSLVARAARDRQGVIVNDVYQDPGFLPNPLLPDTQAEMAVPIIAGDTLLGVLDVQAEQINRFSEEDVTILTTLATQVAVALQNARQYEQVRQSEQLVRAIIDSTPDWIYIKDRQHRYLMVNQSYARSVHLPVEEIVGKDDLEIGHPEELVKGNPEKGIRGYWGDDNEVMNEGHPLTTPRNYIEIDGQLRMYNTYKVPLRDADNNVRGVLAFARDMTEREILFTQSEALYDASRRLIAAQDIQELVAAVAEGMKVPDINRAVLFDIHRDESGEWQDITCIGNWHSGVGSPPTPVGRVYAKGAFPGVELFINPEPIFFDDIQNDKHFYAASAEVLRQQNILSMAVIPLFSGSNHFALLLLESEVIHRFTDMEIRSYPALVGQLASRLQNLRLIEQTRAALAQAQQAEQFQRVLLDNVPAPIYFKDSAGLYIGCNSAFEQYIGRPEAELIGKTVYEINPDKELADRYHEMDMQLIHNPGTQTYETQARYADGSLHDVIFHRSTFFEADGSVGGLISIVTDITERKKAEQELRASEEYNKVLFAGSRTPLIVMDLETATYVDCNQAAVDIYRYASREEVIGKNPLDVSAPVQYDGTPSSEAAGKHIQECIEKGQSMFEWRHQRPDGEIWDASVHLMSLKPAGRQLIQFSLQDITERRRAEAALTRRAAELATVARVSTAVSTLLEPQEMLQTVCDLTKENFHLYHAHIYVFDPTNGNLTLTAGAGQTGKRMVAEGRSIPIDAEKSLVARAARTREGFIVNDVRQDPEFLPHPLLPDTRSEMAVTMQAGEQLIGVLDVQAETIDRFSEEDINILTTLGAQVAVALQNARQYEQAARLGLTVEQSLDGAAIANLDGVIEFVNPAYANMHGLSVEECLGRPLTIFHTPEQVQNEVEPLLQEVSNTGSAQGEIGHVRKDGTIFPSWMSVVILRNRKGEPIGWLATTQDITARKQAERILAESAAQLHQAMQIAQMGSWEVDLNTQVITLSREHVALMGLDDKEPLVLPLMEYAQQYVHPEDVAIIADRLQYAIAHHRDADYYDHFEYRLVTTDGKELDTAVSIRSTTPGLIQGVTQDITARKQAERTLVENEARFRSLVQAVPDMIFRLNPNNVFVDFKAAEDELLYVPPEVFLGKIYTDVLPPHVSEPTRKAIEEARTTGRISSYEYQLPASDGSLRTFEARIAVSPDNYITDIVRDVTVSRETERILAENEARFRSLVSNVPSTIYRCALDAHYTMLFISDAVEEMSGYPASDFLGNTVRSYASIIHPDDVALVDQTINTALAANTSYNMEYRILHASGQTRWVYESGLGVKDTSGNVTWLDGSISDITERKQVQAVMEAQQRTLQAVLDNMPAGLFMVEAPSGKTLLANRLATEILGRGIAPDATPEELSQVYAAYKGDSDELYPMQELPLVRGLMGEVTTVTDMVVHRSDGKHIPLEVTGSPVRDAQGNIVASVIVFQDITERLQNQEAITRRARELAMVAQLSTSIATILEPQTLLQTVSDLAKQNFNFYHAHVYLLNEAGDTLVLAAGAGNIGRQMVAERRSIPFNAEKSLVARAARSRQGVIVNNVYDDPDFLPHPLLPETRSEMAIPLIAGERVLGVLDVQADTINRFSEEDVSIQTTLAAQVAIALQNARQYNQVSRLSLTVEQSLDGAALANMDGVVEFVNSAWANMHGMSVEECVGKLLPAFHTAEQFQNEVEPSLQQANATGSFRGEIGHVRKDGTTFPTWMSVVVVRNSAGQTIGWMASAQDITERKRAQAALETQQRTLQAVLDNMPAGVFMVESPSGKPLLANTLAVDILGRGIAPDASSEDLSEVYAAYRGDSDELYPSEKLPVVRGMLGEATKVDDMVVHRPDGKRIPLEVAGAPVQDAQGNIVASVIVFQDITERKEAQTTLETQQRTLQAVLDNMPAGLFMVEAPSGKTLLANRLATEILGRGIAPDATPEELSQVYAAYKGDSDELYPMQELPLVRGLMGEVATVTDMVVHRSDGKHIPLEVTGSPVRNAQGDIVASVIVFQDITERKQAQATLEAQQRTLQAVLDNMPAGLFMVEAPSGKTLLANRLATEILGRGIAPDAKPEELSEVFAAYKGDSAELYPSQELPLVRGLMGEVTTIDDMVVHRSDGRHIPLEVTGSPVRNAQGDIVASVIVFQDITERKQNQEAITRRARELAVVAHLSTTMSTVLEPQTLLQTVSDLAKQNFNLYHAHIYLLNEAGDTLVLTAGAGDIGRQMVAENRTIAMDAEKSLVARAARSRQGVIVNNVYDDPDFLPHPLLPETRSEMAIPLIAGERVLGVLDVQADTINRFSEEDVSIQTTLAAQAAVALQNARQYQQVQESERLVRTIIDSTPDWIYIKDRQHRYRMVNQSYAQNVHLSPEEILGKDDIEVGHPEELVRGNPEKGIHGYWADDNEVMDGGHPITNPRNFIQVAGEERLFNTYKVPLRDAENNVWGVLAFSRDMTERENLLRETQRLLGEIDTLYGASRRLSAARGLSEMTAAVAEGLKVKGANRALLLSIERDSDGEMSSLTILANWYSGEGHPPSPVGTVYRKDTFAMLRFLLSPVPVFFNDVSTDERIDDNMRTVLDRLEIRSLATLPLWLGERQIGVFALEAQELHTFGDVEIRSYPSLAGQLAIAVENWRLLEETQNRARREHILRQITSQVRGAIDPETILRTAVRELGTTLGRQSFIRLGDAEELSHAPDQDTPSNDDQQAGAPAKGR